MQQFHETLNVLHRRFLEGDSAAFDLIAEKSLPILTRRLVVRFKQLGPDVGEAVEDALLDYRRRPSRFDPTRGSFAEYLYRIAWRNALDRSRSEIRRRQREADWARSGASRFNESWEPKMDLAVAKWLRVPASEMEALDLWLAGERRTALLVAALGLSELALLEQRREVKRFKDRMRRRCERLIAGNVSHPIEKSTAEVAHRQRTSKYR